MGDMADLCIENGMTYDEETFIYASEAYEKGIVRD